MKLFKGGVFRNYLFSYLAVVMAICLVLGLSLTMLSASELGQSEQKLYQGRLEMAADYVERQIAALQEMRLQVKTGQIYQPLYLRSNVMYDMDLLENFTRFTSYSGWLQDYYLWYQNGQKVYGIRGTYSQEVFLQYMLNGMQKGEFLEMVKRQGREDVCFYTSPCLPDTLIICMPFYFGTIKAPAEESALVVLVKKAFLEQNLSKMTGASENAAFLLQYGNNVVMQNGTVSEGDPTGAGSNFMVRLTMPLPGFSIFERLDTFRNWTILIILFVALAGSGLAVYAAWHNYQPIQRLYGKYVEPVKNPSNELQTIEKMLHDAMESASFSQKCIDEQLTKMNQQQACLKQQLVMMLISGNDSPVVQRQIEALGYKMSHGLFAIYFLHLEPGGKTESLMKDVEGFSDEDNSLYAAELQANKEYAILANFEEEEQRQVILELLEDALTAHGLKARLQVSRSCRHLGEIACAAIEALNAASLSLPSDAETQDLRREEDRLRELIELTETGDIQQALECLDTIIVRTESTYPSLIMRMYMLNAISMRLHGIAVQSGIALAPENTGSESLGPEAIVRYLRYLVKALCANAEKTPDAAAEHSKGEASAYVREHGLDPNISLSSTAAALGVSTKQVTRMLHADIGMTFKEYLLQLRMEAAKQILRDDGLSITETAEKVGYFNISHFIKCFKEYVGVTPGEWKKYVQRK